MIASADILERYDWWSSLKHGGLLIAPSKLAEHFEESLPALPKYRAEALRRAVLAVQDQGDPTPLLDSAPHARLQISKQSVANYNNCVANLRGS